MTSALVSALAVDPVPPFAVIELLGTVAFAVSGAAVAVRAGMDWLGVAVLAVVTAIGGGSIRDALAGQGPARWITAPRPVAVALVTAAVVIALAHRVPGVQVDSWPAVVVADAAGLAAFTITGTQLSTDAGIGAPVAVLLGVVTGTGGGILRDVLAGQRPLILTADIYALASLCGAACVTVLPRWHVGTGAARWLAVALVLLLRLVAVRRRWSLPRFRAHQPQRPDGGRPTVA